MPTSLILLLSVLSAVYSLRSEALDEEKAWVRLIETEAQAELHRAYESTLTEQEAEDVLRQAQETIKKGIIYLGSARDLIEIRHRRRQQEIQAALLHCQQNITCVEMQSRSLQRLQDTLQQHRRELDEALDNINRMMASISRNILASATAGALLRTATFLHQSARFHLVSAQVSESQISLPECVHPASRQGYPAGYLKETTCALRKLDIRYLDSHRNQLVRIQPIVRSDIHSLSEVHKFLKKVPNLVNALMFGSITDAGLQRARLEKVVLNGSWLNYDTWTSPPGFINQLPTEREVINYAPAFIVTEPVERISLSAESPMS